jgi:glycerophosphoryl diester phosphodiesterase
MYRKRSKLAGPSGAAAAGLLLALGVPRASAQGPGPWPDSIAHGMGNVQDIMLTNSKEAWQTNYANGCRMFEADFWMAADGRLVSFHDGLEERWKLRKGFTHQEFMKQKIAGRFTPLDVEGLAGLMVAKKDWMLVSDVKSDLKPALEQLCQGLAAQGIDCRKRVIPQIYNLRDHIEITNALGFETVILTLYRIDADADKILAFVREHPTIRAITLPTVRAKKELFEQIAALGRPSYVHTIDSPKEIQSYRELGATGVYTNYQCKGHPGTAPTRRPSARRSRAQVAP